MSSPCACPGAGPDCAGLKPVTCEKTGPCSCSMSDGSGEVNLQLLLSGNPTFRDYNSTIFPDGFLYSWNPCEPFSEGSCKDVAACKSASDGSEYYDLGKQDSVQISGGKDASSGDVVVSFAYLSEDGERDSMVVATCTTGDTTTFTAEGQTTENSYSFQLESPCACPNADPLCAGRQTPTCDKTGPCSCRMSDGTGEVDLSPLLAGNPTFKDVPATEVPDDFLYSWNPCEPFDEGSCQGVAVCQKKNDGSAYYDLGRHDSVEIQASQDPITGASAVSFGYTSADGQRSSLIIATCTTGDTDFTVDGQDVPNSYLFQLSSACACPGADADCAGLIPINPTPSPRAGLGGGTVFLIIAVSAFAGYFLVGAIFNKVIRGKQGSEVIPNVQFWKNLPGYIKSGVSFLISPCRKTTTYEQI
ncbi:uncharacterized protein [Branchiostoma lanceolatum]|uniref:uncharacterized protein n=1 Tax=Branchiostoma lanceolatum TaxID=7740 RepID=UPI0034551A35